MIVLLIEIKIVVYYVSVTFEHKLIIYFLIHKMLTFLDFELDHILQGSVSEFWAAPRPRFDSHRSFAVSSEKASGITVLQ